MTTKERVQAELENLSEQEMADLLRLIRGIKAHPQAEHIRKPGLLSKLKQVKIEAPEDFASRLDDYVSGEKRIGDASDVH